ncbi:kinesin-like protein KIFC3 isoform X2 [Pristis pectinata]|uniref:kinesin-like protein KIFC3 isoform X2 n=1 Tax=Pristis pectinata TaxID=685728 RepID=UPI00223E687C|nr:kinesin-like protein KIFC3 isoform X2 [Pristis pectinata]
MISCLQEDKVRLQEELNTTESKQQGLGSTPQSQGTTDLEKHLEILVLENDRLKQELNGSQLRFQQFRASLPTCTDCEHSKENSRLREQMTVLQLELEEKTRQLSELEQHLKDVLQDRAEREERLNKRIRDCHLALAKQSTPGVKYMTKKMEVESSRMKQDLEEAQSRNHYLQEQIGIQRQLLTEQEQQLQDSWRASAQLQAQIMMYEAELEQAQGEMLTALQKMEDEKNQAIEEVFQHARSEMKIVHDNLNGVRMNLLSIQPALKTLTSDYNCLKNHVRDFPCLLQDAVSQTKKEIYQAVEEAKEINQDLLRKYKREMQLRKKCHNELVRLRGNIRVLCRVRPITREDGAGPDNRNVVSFDQDDDAVLYVSHRGKTSMFELDKVFQPYALQADIFREVQALITSCIDGYNVCIFAYGQTGSGKTYTMEGLPEDPGINQRALQHLFGEVAERSTDWDLTITVSMAEIYNETLRNLLAKDPSEKLEIKLSPDGSGQLYVPGLIQIRVQSVDDINKVFELGRVNRATDFTNVNERSSRSHALLIVSVTGINLTSGVRTTGKLNLVDLAGSERVGKSGAEGPRLREAQNINKSLLALGDVICALRSKQPYIPFRNSKLTYLLQDSLSGDSKTLMMVQVSPMEKNVNETICSLKFAQRVRSVELGAAGRRVENQHCSSRQECELESSLSAAQQGRHNSYPGGNIVGKSTAGKRRLVASSELNH